MRVMAIDYGTKAIGVAVSDELRLTVRPLTTIRGKSSSRRQIISQLKQLSEDYQPTEIVVGLPIRMDGSIGDAAERVKKFIAELQQAVIIPVIAQDERLTSREAEQIMRDLGLDLRQRKAKSDEYAAAVILREYLDSQP